MFLTHPLDHGVPLDECMLFSDFFKIRFSRESCPQKRSSSAILASRASSPEGCFSVKAVSPRASYSLRHLRSTLSERLCSRQIWAGRFSAVDTCRQHWSLNSRVWFLRELDNLSSLIRMQLYIRLPEKLTNGAVRSNGCTPLNHVLPGPVQSLHLPDGEVLHWPVFYEAEYIRHVGMHHYRRLERHWEEVKEYERLVREDLCRSGYRSTVEGFVRDYVRILDGPRSAGRLRRPVGAAGAPHRLGSTEPEGEPPGGDAARSVLSQVRAQGPPVPGARSVAAPPERRGT